LELLLYDRGIDNKSLATGIIAELIIGFTALYAVTSSMVDLERLSEESVNWKKR